MRWIEILLRREDAYDSMRNSGHSARRIDLLGDVRGAALLEFAISLPLLAVFVVGIYDFSGAFNQKQKVAQAAQEGAIIAGGQPTGDIATTNSLGPDSLQPVVAAILNSLVGSGVVAKGACTAPGTVSNPSGRTWKYTISGCSAAHPSDNLIITINRGWVPGGGAPTTIGTMVTVSYPYRWVSYGVIQTMIPGATTQVSESASVHNQI